MIRAAARVQALTSVARHLGAKLVPEAGARETYLVRRGKRIALDVIAVGPLISSRRQSKPPRLRFDRVVVELFDRLRSGLDDAVPTGTTVVVTVTAPVRRSGKTAVEILEHARKLLAARSAGAELAIEVHGNQIRIQILRSGSPSAPKTVGFVHNRDSDPSPLFGLTQALLRGISTAAGERAGGRWLVIMIEDGPEWMKTYGHVCAQLVADPGFERVVLVGSDGQVSMLDE